MDLQVGGFDLLIDNNVVVNPKTTSMLSVLGCYNDRVAQLKKVFTPSTC